MQILDFSQTYQSVVWVDSNGDGLCKNPSIKNKNLLKHYILNSVRNTFCLNKKNYGQMIIACDSHSWRYDYFPNYKYKRKQNRKGDDSGVDWVFVKEVVGELITDMQEHFPFPVIKVHGAEGDDILGVCVKHITKTSVTEDVLGFSDPEPVLIISTDQDNFQLHQYKNVRQYSYMQKKQIKPPISWKHSIIEKIVKGESSDGICNIKSQDDAFVTGTRQKPISSKYLNEFISAKNPIDACLTEEERKNYVRNETLVSYEKIPTHIQDAILLCYNEQATKKHSKMGLMNYLTKNRMSNLLSNIHDFYL